MKKQLLLVFSVITIMLIITSCNSKSKQDDVVRIWEYKYKNMNGNLTALLQLMEKEIYYYAKQNNIKVEIVKYHEDELSYNDFITNLNVMHN